VKNEEELLSVTKELYWAGVRFSRFYEPDVEEFTSIATEPLRGDMRKCMKKYRLLK
jgi:hypothetical protein